MNFSDNLHENFSESEKRGRRETGMMKENIFYGMVWNSSKVLQRFGEIL